MPVQSWSSKLQHESLEGRVRNALEFTSKNLSGHVLNAELVFNWLGNGEHFWYRKRLDAERQEFVLV